MQRIFDFEVATALKDRPRFFRLITLVLLSFSVLVIVLHSFTFFTSKNKNDKKFQPNNGNPYANMAADRATQLLQLKK